MELRTAIQAIQCNVSSHFALKRLSNNILYIFNKLQFLLETLHDILRLHIACDQEQLSTKQKNITVKVHAHWTRRNAKRCKAAKIRRH